MIAYWNCYKISLKRGERLEVSKEDIKEMVEKPCEYCGYTGDRMGVDRKENDIGYLRSNLVPCCIRCNALKRDMPFAAWKSLVPAVRAAVVQGLFGDWVGHPSKGGRKSIQVV